MPAIAAYVLQFVRVSVSKHFPIVWKSLEGNKRNPKYFKDDHWGLVSHDCWESPAGKVMEFGIRFMWAHVDYCSSCTFHKSTKASSEHTSRGWHPSVPCSDCASVGLLYQEEQKPSLICLLHRQLKKILSVQNISQKCHIKHYLWLV